MNLKIQFLGDLRKFGVYKITNIITQKVYVGSTTKSFSERWSNHLKLLRKGVHSNQYLQRSFSKYGEDSFEFTILEICSKKSFILEREQYWIDHYNSAQRGYNLDPVANRSQRSLETALKISNTLKEKYASGKLVCHNTGEHIAGRNRGVKCPKISRSRRLQSRSIKIFDCNKNLIAIFRSCIDLCEWSEKNIMPGLIITPANKKGYILRKDKIYYAIRTNTPYKGLYFEATEPLHSGMGVAKWVNSGKAEMPILSQAEDESSEGAETTGEVQSS